LCYAQCGNCPCSAPLPEARAAIALLATGTHNPSWRVRARPSADPWVRTATARLAARDGLICLATTGDGRGRWARRDSEGCVQRTRQPWRTDKIMARCTTRTQVSACLPSYLSVVSHGRLLASAHRRLRAPCARRAPRSRLSPQSAPALRSCPQAPCGDCCWRRMHRMSLVACPRAAVCGSLGALAAPAPLPPETGPCALFAGRKGRDGRGGWAAQ
jgi:hypothetical protein